MTGELALFSGTANPALAEAIAHELRQPLTPCQVQRFPDGEISVHLEDSVRGQSVFIVQPTSPPVDANLMELLAFADACRRASAAGITAVVPYFGYARADKRGNERQAIMASLVADLMQTVGIQHVITMDLHAPQIEGFFRIPVDSLSAVPVLYESLKAALPPNAVVVSPDTGRVEMAIAYAQRLGTTVAVLHKQRTSGTQTDVTHVVGDVSDRPCLIIDDMISTGGTIAKSIDALLEAGAKPHITVAATHGLFVEEAQAKLSHSSLQRIFATDTIPSPHPDWAALHIVSIAPRIATVIQRMLSNSSVSSLNRS